MFFVVVGRRFGIKIFQLPFLVRFEEKKKKVDEVNIIIIPIVIRELGLIRLLQVYYTIVDCW